MKKHKQPYQLTEIQALVVVCGMHDHPSKSTLLLQLLDRHPELLAEVRQAA